MAAPPPLPVFPHPLPSPASAPLVGTAHGVCTHFLVWSRSQLAVERAKLEAESGDQSRARVLYAELTRRRSATPYAFQCAALLENKHGDADAAREYFSRGARLERRLDHANAKGRDQLMPLLHAWAVFEWRQGDARAARALFARAEKASRETPSSWLYQWFAQFEADCGNTLLARHYYSRAVNLASHDSSAWRMWAELEAESGDAELSQVLVKHAAHVETEALLVDAAGQRRNSGTNPLARADMYNMWK